MLLCFTRLSGVCQSSQDVLLYSWCRRSCEFLDFFFYSRRPQISSSPPWCWFCTRSPARLKKYEIFNAARARSDLLRESELFINARNRLNVERIQRRGGAPWWTRASREAARSTAVSSAFVLSQAVCELPSVPQTHEAQVSCCVFRCVCVCTVITAVFCKHLCDESGSFSSQEAVLLSVVTPLCSDSSSGSCESVNCELSQQRVLLIERSEVTDWISMCLLRHWSQMRRL